MGPLVESVPILEVDLRCKRLAAEFRHWTWMGGRRAAAAGEDGILSERVGRGSAACACEPGEGRGPRRCREGIGSRVREARDAGGPELLDKGREALRLCAG